MAQSPPSDSVDLHPSSAPRLSPRIGTHPAHANPAVQAYHQNLSSHLHSLLRSASNTGQPAGALKPPALVETGRKTSDESLSVTEMSQVGSGSTGIDGKSTLPSSAVTVSTVETVSAVEPRAGSESGGLEMEDDEDEPPQLTARPELTPRRSLTHVPLGPGRPHSSTSSSSSARRHVAAANREAELQQAWQAEGKRVWRAMPDGFTLKMEREDTGGSESSARRRKTRADGVGLGIGLGDSMEREMEGLSIGRTASRGTTTSNFTGGSSFSRSPNIPTNSSFVDTAAATAASTRPSRSTSRQERPLRDVETEVEKEEYEAKRLARLERKRGELERRIKGWYKDVKETCTEEDNQAAFLSEIVPTPSSPNRVTKRPSFTLPSVPAHTTLPFNNPHSFSTKQQPLFVIPPTPDCEKPSSIFEAPSSFPQRSPGVDLTAKLRALEALMGPTPETIDRPYALGDAAQVGEATIRGRRKSGEQRAVQEMDVQTPRVGSLGR